MVGTLRSRSLLTLSTALFLGLAACGSGSPAQADDALLSDLEQASAAGIELAPRASGTQVVSAVERTGATPRPVVSPKKRTPAPAPKRTAPQPEAPPAQVATTAPAPEPEAEIAPVPTPEPEPIVERAPAVMMPQSAPAATTCPRGCRSVSDVIRNAPFPIKPAIGG
jgi:hypothetical protein